MPTLKHAFVVLCVVAAAGGCASGCARREAGPKPPATMRVGVGVPARATAGAGVNHLVSSLTMETWLTTQPDGRLTERVVRDWKWDESGTVLRLNLRDNVRFHDGTLLTPDIAAEAIRETAAENRKNNTYASLLTIRSALPAAGNAVEIQLSEPDSFLLPDLSLISLTLPGRPNLGAGPFKMLQQEGQAESDDQPIVFRAFPQYYRGRPALDEIVLTNHKTQRNAWSALLRGDIDMLYEISQDAVDFVKAETTVESYSFPRPYSINLGFNVRRDEALERNAARHLARGSRTDLEARRVEIRGGSRRVEHEWRRRRRIGPVFRDQRSVGRAAVAAQAVAHQRRLVHRFVQRPPDGGVLQDRVTNVESEDHRVGTGERVGLDRRSGLDEIDGVLADLVQHVDVAAHQRRPGISLRLVVAEDDLGERRPSAEILRKGTEDDRLIVRLRR